MRKHNGLKSSIKGSVEGMTFGIQLEAFFQDFQRHGWDSVRLPGKGSHRGKYLKMQKKKKIIGSGQV